jgi:hypothetical protein
MGKSDQEVYQMYRLLGLSEAQSRELTTQVLARYKKEKEEQAYVNLPFNWSQRAIVNFVVAFLVVLFFTVLMDPFSFITAKGFIGVFTGIVFYIAMLRGFIFLRTPPDFDKDNDTRNLGRERDWKWLIVPALFLMGFTIKFGEHRAEEAFQNEAFLTIATITDGSAKVYDNGSSMHSNEYSPFFTRYASGKTDIAVQFIGPDGKEVYTRTTGSTYLFSTSYIGRNVVVAYHKEASPSAIILESANAASSYKGPQSVDYQLMSKEIFEGKGALPIVP